MPAEIAILDAEVLYAGADQLGEGPVWDAARGELLRVDITPGLVHRLDPATGAQTTLELGDLTSFAIPRAGGGLVAGVRHDVVLVEPDGARRVLASAEADRADNRFNDGKCDPTGRLWAGTMSMVREPGSAALYRLEGEELVPAVEGLVISNGLDWSADGKIMYLIDSPTQRIDVLDVDPATGEVADRRAFAAIDPADGMPDGLTVDAEGGVWVALFGGGAVRRFAPDGTLDAVGALPVTNCTCPVFGGAALDELFITSARHRLDASQLRDQPLAGAVFRVRAGVRGRLGTPFAG